MPNASLLGHLAGIITGLVYTNLALPIKLLSAPFRTSMSSTFLLASLATGLHFDLVEKPWTTSFFWSSKSSLVCLNSNFVFGRSQWVRLISGPLEHHGTAHFAMCLLSFLLKGRFLESQTKHQQAFLSRTLRTLTMMVATSLVYIVASELAEDLMGYSQAPECVQGLSGLNFALKVSVILSWYKCGKEKTYPYIIFEVRSFMCRVFSALF